MLWTPIEFVFVGLALSGALTSTVVTIIAAIKGNAAQAQLIAAQAQAAANRQAIKALADRVQGHDQQLKAIGIHMPPHGSVRPSDSVAPGTTTGSCEKGD